MAFLQSNVPYFKAWVRREYTKNMEEYHGEFLHCMVVAVTSMPNRTLSFQVIFTGYESDENDEPNVHGGAMCTTLGLYVSRTLSLCPQQGYTSSLDC